MTLIKCRKDPLDPLDPLEGGKYGNLNEWLYNKGNDLLDPLDPLESLNDA